jgi:hypothetical protein
MNTLVETNAFIKNAHNLKGLIRNQKMLFDELYGLYGQSDEKDKNRFEELVLEWERNHLKIEKVFNEFKNDPNNMIQKP